VNTPLRRIDPLLLTEELLRPADHVVTVSTDERRRMSQQLGEAPRGLRGPLRIDNWTLRTGLTAHEGRFSWTPQFAKRSLGLAALRSLVFGIEATPSEAVAREIDRLVRLGEASSSSFTSLSTYLASCSLAQRTAAMAHAVTYVTDLYCAVDWEAFERHFHIGAPDATVQMKGQGLVLRGRAEVVAQIERRSSTETAEARLVIMHGVIDDATTVLLGASALAATLASGDESAPVRMVAYFPTSNQAAVLDVTNSVLSRTALGIGKRVANLHTHEENSRAA
jgi:hypothetical protein